MDARQRSKLIHTHIVGSGGNSVWYITRLGWLKISCHIFFFISIRSEDELIIYEAANCELLKIQLALKFIDTLQSQLCCNNISETKTLRTCGSCVEWMSERH